MFQRLSSKPSDITDDDLAVLERFVVLLYDRTCEFQTLNEARRYLFSKKSREMENIPPSQAALLEHSKRAAFQAGHIWGQTLVSEPEVPSRLRNHVWNFYVASARKLAEETVNVTKEI